MSGLSQKKCLPCLKATPPLQGEALHALHAELGNTWEIINGIHLEKNYTFKNFKEALAFVNAIGEVAELEGHHPDLLLSWGKVSVKLWTHKIQGLSESDFILAAKVDALYISKTGHC